MMAEEKQNPSVDSPVELPDDLNYEAALAQLEQIIASLEAGELSLEQALARYEEGAALAAYCEQQLTEADLRVRKWQPGNGSGTEPDGESVDFDG